MSISISISSSTSLAGLPLREGLFFLAIACHCTSSMVDSQHVFNKADSACSRQPRVAAIHRPGEQYAPLCQGIHDIPPSRIPVIWNKEVSRAGLGHDGTQCGLAQVGRAHYEERSRKTSFPGSEMPMTWAAIGSRAVMRRSRCEGVLVAALLPVSASPGFQRHQYGRFSTKEPLSSRPMAKQATSSMSMLVVCRPVPIRNPEESLLLVQREQGRVVQQQRKGPTSVQSAQLWMCARHCQCKPGAVEITG